MRTRTSAEALSARQSHVTRTTKRVPVSRCPAMTGRHGDGELTAEEAVMKGSPSQRGIPEILLRVVLASLIAVLPVGIPTGNAAMQSSGGNQITSSAKSEKDLANYDVRDDESPQGRAVLERYREKVSKDRKEKIKDKKEKIRGAKAKFESDNAGAEVELSKHTGGPEIVGTKMGRGKLTGRGSDKRDNIARGFLKKNADLYGLSNKEINELKKIADY